MNTNVKYRKWWLHHTAWIIFKANKMTDKGIVILLFQDFLLP